MEGPVLAVEGLAIEVEGVREARGVLDATQGRITASRSLRERRRVPEARPAASGTRLGRLGRS